MIKKLITSWVVCILIGCLIGCPFGFLIADATRNEPEQEPEVQTQDVEAVVTAPITTTNIPEVPQDDFISLDIPMGKDLQKYIYHLCGDEIEFALVMALINCESSFKPDAISETADWGLMQINEVNHDRLTNELGVTNYLNPYQNTKAGVHILKELFEKYEVPAMVLMAYKHGEKGASDLWEQGVFETTYTNKILKLADEYRQQISGKEGESNG